MARVLQVKKGNVATIELNNGFFKGFKIEADYKDRKAMELVHDLTEDLDDCTMQDILDVANRVIAWVGLIEVLNQNAVGEEECQT
jgi:hypothetical protein